MDLETFEGIGRKLSLSTMGKPALIGIAAIMIVVAVAAGRLLLGTATATEFSLSKSDAAESAQVEQAEEADSPSTIFVHVSGEVVRPGLCEVEKGARVADAVKSAGGFTQDAATESVNLARTLEDGEQIVVAKKASEDEMAEVAGQGQAASAVAGTGAAAAASSSGLVNINLASETELVTLPGIGEATAAKIVADRQANGSYRTIEDLKRVSGIGDKKFEALSGLICV